MTLSFHYTPDDYHEAVTGTPKRHGFRALAGTLAAGFILLVMVLMLVVLVRYGAARPLPEKALWVRALYAAVPSLLLAALLGRVLLQPIIKGPVKPWEQGQPPAGGKSRGTATPGMVGIALAGVLAAGALSWLQERATAARAGSPAATHSSVPGWTSCFSDPDLTIPLIPWAFLAAVVLLAATLQQRRGLYKLWEVQPPLRRPHQVEFSDHGAVVVDEVTRTVSKWPAFEGFRETPNLFVLYTSPLAFLIVPKRAFADESQADAFRGMALNRVGKGSFLPQSGGFPVQRVLPVEAAPPGAQPA